MSAYDSRRRATDAATRFKRAVSARHCPIHNEALASGSAAEGDA